METPRKIPTVVVEPEKTEEVAADGEAESAEAEATAEGTAESQTKKDDGKENKY